MTDPNSNVFLPPNSSQDPNAPETLETQDDMPSFTVHNWIAAAFIVLLIIDGSVSYDTAEALFPIVLLFGVIAGFSFFFRMIKFGSSRDVAAQGFSVFVGICGGIVIFIIALFVGFASFFHLSGD